MMFNNFSKNGWSDEAPVPTLTAEQNFIWLLREDIRGKALVNAPSGRRRFLAWWALNQRKEYPKASDLTDAQITYLTTPMANAGVGSTPPLTHLMIGVWELLDHIRSRFDLHSEEGRTDLFDWYCLTAVSELGLDRYLSADQRRYLADPVALVGDTGLPVTRAMLSLWRFRKDVRGAFDLGRPDGLRAFLSWVLVYGFKECPILTLYCDEEFKRALKTAGRGLAHGLEPLDSLATALWHAREELQLHFPLNSLDGRHAYLAWHRNEGQRAYGQDVLFELAQTPPPQARTAAAPRRALTPGVNLIGFARGELGIGEDVRMAAKACAAVGIPFTVYDTPPGPTHRQADRRLDAYITTEAPHAVNVFCLTGFDTARTYVEHPNLFESRYNIGYWPWELPDWPASWASAYDIVDEIWVSTRYTQEAFALTAPVPVLLMPMAVAGTPARAYRRADFGLPEGRFLFLFTFDWNSYVARKNPGACIDAFQAAFPPGGAAGVGLVLKVMGGRDDDPRWRALLARVAADPRILVLHGTLDRNAVLGLATLCDAVISLHRSEGFGRTLAEAMLLGKPTIATDHSGNTDFCTPETCALVPGRLVPVQPGEYPWGEGMMWAEPDVGQAALAMRRLVSDHAHRELIARAGQRLVATRHDPCAVGLRYKRRIEALLSRLARQSGDSRAS
ncbi:glycosyltransferase [Azospirillum formosense]|uniref:Glycosyltransferase n=1 Tax=Azospirillum formosense TaxID=861533 RepID=A0ABX2KXT5_9PROT|nr:glycosyltransferase [Azospirillum formosense]MBY3757661.1 glycosyltransferase [Azospirillum formosense]NUB20152.1 glycosyltransferase [Azospirillum formosense]